MPYKKMYTRKRRYKKKFTGKRRMFKKYKKNYAKSDGYHAIKLV